MRRDVIRLNSGILEQLKEFQKDDDSFKTLPKIAYKGTDADISVGSTCTALMALLATRQHDKLMSKLPKNREKTPIDVASLLKRLVTSKWGSSGLPDGNWFTTALVMRTAGFAVNAGILSTAEAAALKHEKYASKNERCEETVDPTVENKTLQEIIDAKLQEDDDKWFAVSGYPPKATIAYWFVDGATNAGLNLDTHLPRIASWATKQFHQQLINVSAGNDALMDPPELAMAACLINRIHRHCNDRPELGLLEITHSLPSQIELQFAIKRVLVEQPNSGIWHKYFPLFHFPHGGGAADYCFSFEFLEAILVEFGVAVLQTKAIVEAFGRSVAWCDGHLLHFVTTAKEHYRGWNSGGEVRNLSKGMPESWATATVHMFLERLDQSIGDLLSTLVLKRYGIDRNTVVESEGKFKGLIDVKIKFPNESETTLLTVLKNELIDNAQKPSIGSKLGTPRSALFFGPPGTSKTGLAKAIAAFLGWPIVIITPSNFLSRGLEQVHALVDEVFTDLMDLRKTVVFFDEMDALAQSREERPGDNPRESLDVTRQLLTTSMLPKLADLWEQAQVIFLMATNHKQQLDPAITRANRFDLLLCVAPPPWSGKRSSEKLARILEVTSPDAVEEELKRLVPNGSKAEQLLDLFTVSELAVFFDHLKRMYKVKTLLGALRECKTIKSFGTDVEEWAAGGIALRAGEPARKEFDVDFLASRRQYYLKEEPLKKTDDAKEKVVNRKSQASSGSRSPTNETIKKK